MRNSPETDKIRFIKVTDPGSISEVAALAHRIWREHYTALIGEAQVDYMLAKFQSPEAIREQMAEQGYHYYLIRQGAGVFIGYLGFHLNSSELFLSKIYLTRESRGHGYGREAIGFLEKLARGEHCTTIVLTVNKGNLDSIAAYEKMGFCKAAPIVQDIGGGFLMDDYRMEKRLKG